MSSSYRRTNQRKEVLLARFFFSCKFPRPGLRYYACVREYLGVQIMKQLLLLVGCAVFLSVITGCQTPDKGADVIIEGGDAVFPEYLVGVWEADKFHWGFKFEPDGSISKLIHTLGTPINVDEGGFYEEGPEDSYGIYVLGPCEASYDRQTRQLNVKIVLDYFRMVLPFDVLEGRSEDYFKGQISEDGKTWNVKWRNYGWLEGAAPPDPNIIEAHPQPLVFTKLDLEKLKGG